MKEGKQRNKLPERFIVQSKNFTERSQKGKQANPNIYCNQAKREITQAKTKKASNHGAIKRTAKTKEDC